MKKISIFMCMFLIVSLVISGCGSVDNKQNEDESNVQTTVSETETSEADSMFNKIGEYPITKEKLTLKLLTLTTPFIIDINTNEFTIFVEDKTNIHIEWEMIPLEQGAEQLNLVLASGDYPDVFYRVGINDSQEALYGVEQKVLIPLNDLIDRYCPNIKEAFGKHTTIKGAITATDGKIYSLPSWNDAFHATYPQKLWLNQLWMENLGLDAPKTTDELYNVLKAFKENDPNGNGKADEIGLLGTTDSWYSNIDTFLMNSFILDSGMYDPKRQIVKDGKVMTIVNTPEYREGLRYINKLFKEGLIYHITHVDPGAKDEVYRQYAAIAPVKGPGGKQYATHLPNSSLQPGHYSISKDCEYPEAAIRWADAMYTHEMSLTMQYGKKGKGWTDASKGAVGLNGKPALHKTLTPWTNEPQNYGYLNIGLVYFPSEFRLGDATDPNIDPYSPEGLEKLLFSETKEKYEPYKPTDCEVMPTIKLTASETDDLQTISVELNKYIEESKVRFITGDMNIDSDWDKYVENLNNIGLKKYYEIFQKAYDRQYK